MLKGIVALGALLAPIEASAATLQFTGVVDLGQATASSFGGFDAPLTGNNLVVSSGDVVQGTISFVNGLPTITEAGIDGREFFGAYIGGPSGPSGTYVVTNITGASAGYTGGGNYSEGNSYGISANVRSDVTTTQFSFTGLTFTAYVNEGQSATIRPTAFYVRSGYVTGAVPEPTTWAMLLVGFGMIAGAARYRRRSTTTTFA